MIDMREDRQIESDQLNALWQAIGWSPRPAQRWEEVLARSTYVVSAWSGEQLVGFARTLADGVMCMVYDVGVHPRFQLKGIGSMLMRSIRDRVADHGYASIGLFAWEENPSVTEFYARFGFERVPSGMELKALMVPE